MVLSLTFSFYFLFPLLVLFSFLSFFLGQINPWWVGGLGQLSLLSQAKEMVCAGWWFGLAVGCQWWVSIYCGFFWIWVFNGGGFRWWWIFFEGCYGYWYVVGLLSVIWVLWPMVVGFDMGLDLLWVVWILWSVVVFGGGGLWYGVGFFVWVRVGMVVGSSMVVVLLWL